MNILFLDQFSDMGGAQRCLVEVIDAVIARGGIVRCALPGAGELRRALADRGVGTIEIPCGPYGSGVKKRSDLFRFAADLPRQVRLIADLSRDCDLVYVNGARLLPAASLGARCRVLFHAHSHIPQSMARRLAVLSVRRSGAAVIACSRSVAEPYESAASSLRVIPNGVPEVPFRERRFNGSWRIGVVGRISPEKGQAEFIEAVRLLQPECPDVRFAICGAPLFGATDYFERIRVLARGLPVEFVGWNDNLNVVYDGLDLLVVPSRLEGMARVVVEAFSAGLPVLAFPTGGIGEVIRAGQNGFFTSAPTPEALAASVRSILATDPADLQSIVARARRDWEQYYTVRLFQQRMLEQIETLLSGASARPGTVSQPHNK